MVHIAPASQKIRYILVIIDYVTKWVESKEISHATKKLVVYFLFEGIFTYFGVLREIFIG